MNPSIEHIFISPAHNYVGHHGGPAGDHPCESRQQVRLIAGRGIEGDRYALREAGHPKQITFFNMDVIDALSERAGHPVPPQSVRRNVFVRGLDLPDLVAKTFTLQGIRFEGVDPCKPCYWMDEAVGPGTMAFLKGKGGLRARILDDGELCVGLIE
ncbi:MAG: MOSC domain-containing protein [Kiritimatiellia bacterium]